MLLMSKQMGKTTKEVGMRSPGRLYKLRNHELLKLLMECTGTGSKVTVRGLAQAAGCSHGKIGNLLDGVSPYVPQAIAEGISDCIGVDLLVLFTPTGRSVPAPAAELAALAVSA